MESNKVSYCSLPNCQFVCRSSGAFNIDIYQSANRKKGDWICTRLWSAVAPRYAGISGDSIAHSIVTQER